MYWARSSVQIEKDFRREMLRDRLAALGEQEAHDITNHEKES